MIDILLIYYIILDIRGCELYTRILQEIYIIKEHMIIIISDYECSTTPHSGIIYIFESF